MPLQNNCLKNKEGKQHLFAIPHVAVQQRQIEIIVFSSQLYNHGDPPWRSDWFTLAIFYMVPSRHRGLTPWNLSIIGEFCPRLGPYVILTTAAAADCFYCNPLAWCLQCSPKKQQEKNYTIVPMTYQSNRASGKSAKMITWIDRIPLTVE